MRWAVVVGVVLVGLVAGALLWTKAARASGRAREASATGTAPAPPTPPPADRTKAAARVEIDGRIVDEKGLDLSEADGFLRLAIDGQGDALEAQIHGGRWRSTAPRGASLTFEAIEFGGRKAIPLAPTVRTGDPCSLWFTKPGRYRVSFAAAIEGYDPIAPVEVDLRRSAR